MRTYRVYLIEEEVAQLYFGRERSLFNLFLEYVQTTGSLRDILHKQIEYVTKIIPNEQVKKVIEQQKILSSNSISKTVENKVNQTISKTIDQINPLTKKTPEQVIRLLCVLVVVGL